MSVMVEFSMMPLDKGESLSEFVARSLDIIDKSGLDYRIGPMGTTIEGEWDETFAVIRTCYMAMSEKCGRVYASIKVDSRKEGGKRMAAKIESVERKLGRGLNKA
jgi:uncharacterized protein (TIGR00106 family)